MKENKVAFTKMHGLGNDFIIINHDDLRNYPTNNFDRFVKKISDRHLGIGCDQFITYKKHDDNKFEMNIYNQDGSVARACGNASRCLSLLIYDEYKLNEIELIIQDRVVKAKYDERNIEINMGRVSFEENWMPGEKQLWDLALHYGIEPKEIICVDVGNPHIVIFSQLAEKDKKFIGNVFQTEKLFPNGINVNFAQVKDDDIYLKVWERGAGYTYACGSGSVASFAAANKLGFVDKRANIRFELGSLQLSNSEDGIIMRGPAEYVFKGDYYYEQ